MGTVQKTSVGHPGAFCTNTYIKICPSCNQPRQRESFVQGVYYRCDPIVKVKTYIPKVYDKTPHIKTCKFCHSTFLPVTNNRIFCSSNCAIEQQCMNDKKTAYMRLRFEVLKRDGFKCVYCGRSPSDGVTLQIDHIVPQSKGGKTVDTNLVTACQECNVGKSDILLEERRLNHEKKTKN